MSFLFQVNGITRNDFVRYRSLQIRKDGANESARIEFIDKDTRSDAFGVYDGDSLLITQDGGLEFGGEVTGVRVTRLEKTARGILITAVDVQGWHFEAADIVITASFPSQPLLNTVRAIHDGYMVAKGWTSNNAAAGGPVLPALTFTRQSIASIYDELQKHSGWPWRVNGARVHGFVEPGTLAAPVDFTDTSGSVVLTGVQWTRDRVRYATRVLATTGGSGAVTYTDQHVGDGVRRFFPLAVFPNPDALPTEVTEGGTVHTIGGPRWTLDPNDAMLQAATPVAVGVTISTPYQLGLPATVRVWYPTTRKPDGSWSYGAVIDASTNASEQTDLTQALAWAQAELTTRNGNPRAIELSTFAQGFYPWQRANVNLAGWGIAGPYLIQGTTLTDVGTGTPRIDLRLLEGNALGRDWTLYFKERKASSTGGGTVVTGGGTPPSGGGGGSAALPSGTTFRLAGDNVTPYGIGTTWADAPQACPTQLGGPGMAGTWILRVPMYQLTAGTLEVRLFDQTTLGVLATVSTTAVGERLIGPFDFRTAPFTAPADIHDLLLQYRVTGGGTRQVVIGHATVVKA